MLEPLIIGISEVYEKKSAISRWGTTVSVAFFVFPWGIVNYTRGCKGLG